MSINNRLIVMAGIVFIAGMAGCGSVSNQGTTDYSAGTGDSMAQTSGGTSAGKVGILIKDQMDVSNDIPELSQLWVTLNRVSLKRADEMADEGWLTVFEGTARYDLLTLQGNKSALMALVPVTEDNAGYYEKARLEIDETSGVNCFYAIPDSAVNPLEPCTDSYAHLLTVPSGKVDIEFNPQIYLGPDSTQYIVFDLLPADSIKITDTNGNKGYLLRPEVHSYTMPTVLEDNGWNDIDIDELEGTIVEISGCDNTDLPDMLILSPEHGGETISIDITGAGIYIDDSTINITCSSLMPDQEVEAKVNLSGDGVMTAEKIEVEDSEEEGDEIEDSMDDVINTEASWHQEEDYSEYVHEMEDND